MTARADVLRDAFAGGYVGRAAGDRYPIRVLALGELHLPSGRVVHLDPLVSAFDPDAAPLAFQVSPGRYPVDLAVADTGTGGQRVALARARFGGAPVAHWRMAGREGEDPDALTGDAILGYDVDAGTGGFADPAALAALRTATPSFDAQDALINRWLEEGEARAEAAGLEHRFLHEAAAGPGNLVMFSSGWGDGCYASWLGEDAGGRAMQLVTDFAVIEAMDIP